MPIASKLLVQTVIEVRTDKTLVHGPHAGNHLANSTKGVLHCASSEGVTIFGKASITEALCKDLKVRDWVWDSHQ
jgi:hypothetical protein